MHCGALCRRFLLGVLMSEITRVPLQPIAKGSMTKVWLGVAAALALGIGGAYAALPSHFSQLAVETIKDGSGASPTDQDVVLVNYVGRLASSGKEFDKGQNAAMPVAGVIPGFAQGLKQMKRGGSYRIEIPAAMAYGAEPQSNRATGEVVIPGNSDLVFEVELVDFMSQQQIEQQRMMMQQMQQQMGGAPGGAPAPARP